MTEPALFGVNVAYVGPGFGTFLLSMIAGFAIAVALMFLQRKKMNLENRE